MANSIPLTFRAAPLPEGYRAGPEQFKNDIVARLYAESTESISFFASGSVAPSSNVGPWLNNGLTWYVWSDALAMYIPQPIPQASLGYVAQAAAPDHTIYTFWIALDGAGKAQAIKFWSAGAWHDIYEDTFAAITAARIAGDAATLATSEAYTNAQIALIPSPTNFNSRPARAQTPGTQTFAPNGTAVKMTLNSADINPGGIFDTATSEYVTPSTGVYVVSIASQIDGGGGGVSPATMEVTVGFAVNGAPVSGGDQDSTPSPNGTRWSPGFTMPISLAAGDRVSVLIGAADGIGAGLLTVTAGMAGFFKLSQ